MKHLAFVLDGNRRWARANGKLPWQGHEEGAQRVQEIIEWTLDASIPELTLYALSVQNLQRSQEELTHLFTLFTESAKRLLKEREKLAEKGIRIRVAGRLQLLPEQLQTLLQELVGRTRRQRKLTVNLCIAYGGREELTNAVRKIAEEVKAGKLDPTQIDEAVVEEHLSLTTEPDLIIRTGGAKRTSNFLPWQASYSEWYFTDTFLPAMTKEEFFQILELFGQRERRFGK